MSGHYQGRLDEVGYADWWLAMWEKLATVRFIKEVSLLSHQADSP